MGQRVLAGVLRGQESGAICGTFGTSEERWELLVALMAVEPTVEQQS